MLDVKAAAEAAGVSRKAILKRVRENKRRGLTGDDLLSVHKGGNVRITEEQARMFWGLVSAGWSTIKACSVAKITKSQGDNIRSGKSWNEVTGKQKEVSYIGSADDPINIAAEKYGVSRNAILERVKKNKKRGFSGDDLFKLHKNGNYKITEEQAIKFWQEVNRGLSTKLAARLAGITRWQGENIRFGKTWNHITGKTKVVYDDY